MTKRNRRVPKREPFGFGDFLTWTGIICMVVATVLDIVWMFADGNALMYASMGFWAAGIAAFAYLGKTPPL